MMYNQVKKTWAKQSVALDVRLLIIYDLLSLFKNQSGHLNLQNVRLSANSINKTDLSSDVFKTPYQSLSNTCPW